MAHSEKEKRLEILAVLITGLLKFVLVDWLKLRLFFILFACLFWLIFIYKKYKNDPQILKNWGFQNYNLKQSFLALLPFALFGIAGIIIYGVTTNSALLSWHIIPILVFYPAWGLIQQFLIVGLIAGNLRTPDAGKIADLQIILFTALLFSLVHFPHISLVFYAFVLELILTSIYFKWKNLWSIGLFHGWVSSFFLFFVLGRDLLTELWVVFQ